MSDIIYSVRIVDNNNCLTKCEVVGYQVGRFAVRRSEDNAVGFNGQRQPVKLKPWLVDHIETGFIVIAVESFHEAMIVADDVSRFSQEDPDTNDPDLFFKKLGPEIVGWLKTIIRTQQVLDFRQWKAARSLYVSCREQTT